MESKKICIIGLGYVGLPLYIEFSRKYNIIGYDTNLSRVNQLKNAIDANNEFNDELKHSELNFTNRLEDIHSCNIFIITVPTPINEDKSPDISYLKTSFSELGNFLKKDDLVILESTVYPGCSEEICIPILEKKSKLKLNRDFYFGYSPERINPGDKTYTLTTIKKVTSGSNEFAAKNVNSLYSSIITAGTHLVSSIKIAEASKILENTQRDLNISLMNEFAFICDKLSIRTNEVIDAAATKWNFQKFTPGLVGGHCIGVDPYYLTYKSIKLGYKPDIILSGRNVNEKVSDFIITKVIKRLLENGKIISKSNCSDFRNSKVIDIYKGFKEFSLETDVYDPLVEKQKYYKENKIQIISELKTYDAIVIAVPHIEIINLNINKLKKDENCVVFDVKGKLGNKKYIQL
jgi:UDP-N-acetyl-D-galactosamine dehydrogenase